MSDPTLLEIIDEALHEKGYDRSKLDPEYYVHPDGSADKLIPTIVDCLEREE